jgi:hypothetical protein
MRLSIGKKENVLDVLMQKTLMKGYKIRAIMLMFLVKILI